MNDLRIAARMLVKNPAFSAVAVLLLAVGIGANAIFFGAFDHVLLRPLPVREPASLVRVVQNIPGIGARGGYAPFAYYEALRNSAASFSAVFGSMTIDTVIGEPAEQIRVDVVTPEYFDTLGVPAQYGRVLMENDAGAVLSYSFWEKRFQGEPAAIGRTISLNGHRFVVAGVMPAQFNGVSTDTSPEVWVSLYAYPLLKNDSRELQGSGIELGARLRPGIGIARGEAEAQAIWRSAMPKLADRGMQLESLERGISSLRVRFGSALQFLAYAAGLLQLIVCANLAGLLIARNAGRAQDLAVRLAMGASRRRLIRQMLAESLLLTGAGALGGIWIAYGCAPLLVRALPPVRDLGTSLLTISLDLKPDWRVLGFSLGVCLCTVILTGLGPAISASRISLDLLLRGARSSGAWRGRQVLLVVQIAICTVLLIGAALLMRTFERLHHINPGFDRQHLAAFTTAPSLSGYKPAQMNALRLALMERVRQIPGVTAVGTADRPLMRGSGRKQTIAMEGQSIGPKDALNVTLNAVSPDYFDAIGTPVIAGRGFVVSDGGAAHPQRVIVNEAFVRHFLGGANPIGRRFGESEIIGVVADAKFRSMREPMTPTYYYLYNGGGDFTLYVRTRAKPEEVIQPVRRALAALDPALPFTEVHTVEEEITASTAPERLTSGLATSFSLAAAVLATVGIYGLFAYVVVQRRREIGIRMAVGARPVDIAEMLGARAAITALLGVGAGMGLALLLGPVVASLLYDVSPVDGRSFAIAGVVMLSAAGIATAFPAFRAAHIHPAEALRND